jgi:hypothetical protein
LLLPHPWRLAQLLLLLWLLLLVSLATRAAEPEMI